MATYHLLEYYQETGHACDQPVQCAWPGPPTVFCEGKSAETKQGGYRYQQKREGSVERVVGGQFLPAPDIKR